MSKASVELERVQPQDRGEGAPNVICSWDVGEEVFPLGLQSTPQPSGSMLFELWVGLDGNVKNATIKHQRETNE